MGHEDIRMGDIGDTGTQGWGMWGCGCHGDTEMEDTGTWECVGHGDMENAVMGDMAAMGTWLPQGHLLTPPWSLRRSVWGRGRGPGL